MLDADETKDYPERRRSRAKPVPHLVLSHSPGVDTPWEARPIGGTIKIGRAPEGDLALRGDSRASREHATVVGWKIRDNDSNNGLFVNGVRGEQFVLQVGDVVRIGDSILVVAPDEPRDHGVSEIFGRSPAVAAAADRIAAVARSAGALLIEGPPGVGKEYASKALQRLSGAAPRKVVSLNCATLREQLAESALFGHKKGSFSGAHRDFDGAFSRANGGVLFLDEIGELDERVQAKLLRVLQDGTFQPVGGVEKRVQVRVVAATNRSLDDDVESGRFRADLLSRLRTFSVRLVGLEERREDILPFLAQELDDWPLTVELAERIAMADYPANLRDLASLAKRIKALPLPPDAHEFGIEDAEYLGVPAVVAKGEAPSYKDRAAFEAASARFPTHAAMARHFGCDPKTISKWADIHAGSGTEDQAPSG